MRNARLRLGDFIHFVVAEPAGVHQDGPFIQGIDLSEVLRGTTAPCIEGFLALVGFFRQVRVAGASGAAVPDTAPPL